MDLEAVSAIHGGLPEACEILLVYRATVELTLGVIYKNAERAVRQILTLGSSLTFDVWLPLVRLTSERFLVELAALLSAEVGIWLWTLLSAWAKWEIRFMWQLRPPRT